MIKKTKTFLGVLVLLGAGLVVAGGNLQAQDQNVVNTQVRAKAQAGILVVDENGDGICDLARDHDGDGIPNCQDADWTKPEDGTGYQSRKGMNPDAQRGMMGNGNRFGNQSGNQNGNSWNRQSFGQSQGAFGTGVCDGTGPKGQARRTGRGK